MAASDGEAAASAHPERSYLRHESVGDNPCGKKAPLESGAMKETI